jgi:hypothetical protein
MEDPQIAQRRYSTPETPLPFEVIGKLVARKLSAEEWQAQCAEAEISDMDLGRLITE